jgi:hypothetical protein
MAYVRICDACKRPIFNDNYISVLVETPQDRCAVAFHDATKYDICPRCYSKIKNCLNQSSEDLEWEFVRR